MASGSFDIASGAGSTLYLRVSWKSTPNTAGNYSTVQVTQTLYHGRLNMNSATNDVHVRIAEANTKDQYTTGPSIYGEGPTTLGTLSFTVPHNSDGTKTCTISASYAIDITYSGTYVSSISGSRTITLDTIARKSSFNLSSSSVNVGSTLGITISRASSSFTHDVTVSLSGRTVSKTGQTTSASIDIPASWAELITSPEPATATVTVVTKSGSTSIGSNSKNISIVVPNNATYTPSISLSVSGSGMYWGKYIQGISRATLSALITNKGGATTSKIVFSGANYTSSGTSTSFTTGILNSSGTITFNCYCIDSRNRTSNTATISINVEEYSSPTFTASAFRSDEDGTPNNEGTYVTVLASNLKYSSCGGSNSCSISVSYKEDGSTSYGNSISLSNGVKQILNGTFETTNKYQCKFVVQDGIKNIPEVVIQIPTIDVFFAFEEDRAGIGIYPPKSGKGLYVKELHSDGNIYQGEKSLNSLYYGTLTNRDANTVLAAPNGSSGVATFRKLVTSDISDPLFILSHVNPDTSGFPGVYGDFASRYGNKYGIATGDNYYFGADSQSILWAGRQVNNSTTITWKKALMVDQNESSDILPVKHGGIGTNNWATALGLTLIKRSVNSSSGENAPGTTGTCNIGANGIHLVIAWSHAAISGIVSAAFCSNYSHANIQNIVSGSYAPTISISGQTVSITRASYRFNYVVYRIGN